jgi:hypothetical protein
MFEISKTIVGDKKNTPDQYSAHNNIQAERTADIVTQTIRKNAEFKAENIVL